MQFGPRELKLRVNRECVAGILGKLPGIESMGRDGICCLQVGARERNRNRLPSREAIKPTSRGRGMRIFR